ncbi:MAG: CPBP family intramembrane metalloprotease [Calditrichaeota bacterium]|nr:MAG: CPBP family intramembrane metalloprotease [Calditrichota bacterium]
MNEQTKTTQPSSLTNFFFYNKVSVSIIVLIMTLSASFISGIGALVSMGLMLLALVLCLKDGSVKMLGLTKPKSFGKTLLLGAVIGFSLQMVFKVIFDPLFEQLTGSQIDLSMLEELPGNLPLYLIWIAIGWIIGGFLEEMSFRGYLIPRVKYLLGGGTAATVIAILASGIPFGIAHLYQGWAGVLSTGIFGILFGILFVLNKENVWLPIFIHGFANMTDLTLIYLGYGDSLSLF